MKVVNEAHAKVPERKKESGRERQREKERERGIS